MVSVVICGVAFFLVNLFTGPLAVIEVDIIQLDVVIQAYVVAKFYAPAPLLHVRFHDIRIGGLVGFRLCDVAVALQVTPA
jgi:hypothetical protein